MKRLSLIILLISLMKLSLIAQTSVNGRVVVSQNKRFLQYENGKPFFYLGETAWELFHRCDREEALLYLKNRAEKGYTVIQAVVLSELDGLNTPNPYNEKPLIDNDPSKPNENYFKHVDYIINLADSLGLVIGLLPTWADKVFKHTWGKGPEIFNADNAEIYGKYLGNRYKNKKNIIWIMGGDRSPEGYEAIWKAMAKGIAIGISGREDYSTSTMTYHTWGGTTSSTWFHNEDWLDFNMWQLGHCYNTPVWEKILADYNKTPFKPVFDSEPLYEEHPICFNANENGYSTDYHVRRFLYHNLFSGAFGQTYGCHAIWQMYKPGREPINGPRRSWMESLNLPGAFQMQYARYLLESKPYFSRVPDQSVLLSDTGDKNERITATRDTDGTYILVYSEAGKGFTLSTSALIGKKISFCWLDPRNGQYSQKNVVINNGSADFTPPTSGIGNDWVLVLDAVK